MIRICALVLLLALSVGPAFAVNPEEMLADTALEQRARDIGAQLRCLVCQNQSIDDSNSGLARDLRIIVRERLSAGDTDADVISFVESRFGHYVRLKPPYTASTYLLWWGPLVVLLAALAVYAFGFRNRQKYSPPELTPLTPDEERELMEAKRLQ